jgi:hypothetical protein
MPGAGTGRDEERKLRTFAWFFRSRARHSAPVLAEVVPMPFRVCMVVLQGAGWGGRTVTRGQSSDFGASGSMEPCSFPNWAAAEMPTSWSMRP